MNLYFLSFGDSLNYSRALSRCEIQAKNFRDKNGKNIFTDVFCVNEDDLKINCPDFLEKNFEFIKNNPKGYGYWIWKPYLILKLMESLDEGDVILYMDSGCQLNYAAVDRLNFYYKKALEFGGVYFRLTHPEFKFTKMDTYKRIFPNQNEMKDSMQNCATSFFIKTSDDNKKFLNEWYSICIENFYRYVDDTPSILDNHESFIDHRHDQSIFSLLVKKYDLFYGIDDETYWKESEWKQKSINYPIWATRNRGSSLILV